MQNFTPLSALIGGSLIGLSATIFLWLNGQIAGISGIFHGLLTRKRSDLIWRLVFLVGLVMGGGVYYLFPTIQFTPRMHYPLSLLIIAGVLVSIGTKLGGGCTSGHGICGISRLSIRSLTATLLFFIFGLFSVYCVRHCFGIY